MCVRITYMEPLLGTASANKELHSDYIASKAPDAPSREEEVASIGVEAAEVKGMTVFPKFTKDDEAMDPENVSGSPFTFDYTWKGFFKESCGMLRRGTGFKSTKLTSYKKVIDGLVFVRPRKIRLVLPDGQGVGELQRPLRASTPQGERVALAHSETVPAGTTQLLKLKLLRDDLDGYVREWLDYGALHGTGQWRNASFGTFFWEEIDEDSGEVTGGNSRDFL